MGCSVVPDTLPPAGFTAVTIPAGHYRVFSVAKGRQDLVGNVWQSIWDIPFSEKQQWRFNCEFERYRESGEIDIFIGVNNP